MTMSSRRPPVVDCFQCCCRRLALSYPLSRPHEWRVRPEHVARTPKVGRRKLQRIFGELSKLIGLAQPDVSKLLRGHFAGRFAARSSAPGLASRLFWGQIRSPEFGTKVEVADGIAAGFPTIPSIAGACGTTDDDAELSTAGSRDSASAR
jgi:hypothetical protein